MQEIVNLKASLNQGISDRLREFFPKTVAISRPKTDTNIIYDPYWLSGFAEGEACFFISIHKSLRSKLGLAVQLVFKITQHNRDKKLLKIISEFFDCGRIDKRKKSLWFYSWFFKRPWT